LAGAVIVDGAFAAEIEALPKEPGPLWSVADDTKATPMGVDFGLTKQCIRTWIQPRPISGQMTSIVGIILVHHIPQRIIGRLL
jgi:hypothetical protein